MPTIYELHRPKHLDEVVGHKKVVNHIKTLAQRCRLVGSVLNICGQSGLGKTSLARATAALVAKPWAIQEIDAQDLSLDLIRDFEDRCCYRALDGSTNVLVANEWHTMRAPIVNRLKTAVELESFQRNGLLILTSTVHELEQKSLFDDNKAGGPFASRMLTLRLDCSGEEQDAQVLEFALYCRKVARAENLDGKELGYYTQLVRRHKMNLRACLMAIEQGDLL